MHDCWLSTNVSLHVTPTARLCCSAFNCLYFSPYLIPIKCCDFSSAQGSCSFHVLSNPFLHVLSALFFPGQFSDSPSHSDCNLFCRESEGNEPLHKTTHDFQSAMIMRQTDSKAKPSFKCAFYLLCSKKLQQRGCFKGRIMEP